MSRRLRRVDCSAPGIRRRRRGRGFSYVDETGLRVDDPELDLRESRSSIAAACSPPRSGCSRSASSASGRRSTPPTTTPTASRRSAGSTCGSRTASWCSTTPRRAASAAATGSTTSRCVRSWPGSSGAAAAAPSCWRTRSAGACGGRAGGVRRVCGLADGAPASGQPRDRGGRRGRAADLPIHQPELERAVLDLICEREPSAAVERIAA
jgi:hypothetical protein